MKFLFKLVFWLLLIALVAAGVAFLIYRTPDIAREELAAQYMTAAQRFERLSTGAEMRIEERNCGDEAPSLLLVHGSNASLETWDAVTGRLAAQFCVVRVDLRGHGLTGRVAGDDYTAAAMAADLEALREMLAIPRWIVVGHSMGGRVAASYALAHPQATAGLVLVAAAGAPNADAIAAAGLTLDPRGAPPEAPATPRSTPLAFRLAQLPGVNRLIEYVTPRDLIAGGLRASMTDQSLITEAMIDRYWRMLRMTGSRAATRIRFSTPETPLAPQNLSGFTAPVAIIWGEADRVVSPRGAFRYQAVWPEAAFHLYEGIGHIPQEEAPDRFVTDLSAFVARVYDPGVIERDLPPL